MEDILEVIKTRRSIRSYTDEPVAEEDLVRVLEAGTYAPSAMGMQSAVIVVIEDKETRERFSRLNAAVIGKEMDPFYGAPVIIAVLSEGANFLQDGACVLENMMLEAHSLGLGTVWVNRELEIFDSQDGKALLEKWNLPTSLRGVGALALGHAKGDAKKAAERKKGYIVRV